MNAGFAGETPRRRHLMIVAVLACAEVSRHYDDGLAVLHGLQDGAHSGVADVKDRFGLKRLKGLWRQK